MPSGDFDVAAQRKSQQGVPLGMLSGTYYLCVRQDSELSVEGTNLQNWLKREAQQD